MEKEIERGKPGRKPGKDNKVPLTIYIEESVVTALGKGFLISGKDIARSVAAAAVYQHHQNQCSP